MAMHRRFVLPLIIALALAGCGGDGADSPAAEPPPNGSTGSTGSTTIQGNERLGWDQTESDPSRLTRYQFRLYVDGTANTLTDVRCASAASVNGIPCSARLPSLAPGPHGFELAAVFEGRESPRSARFSVTVRASLETQSTAAQAASASEPSSTQACGAAACPTHERLSVLSAPIAELAVGSEGSVLAVTADRGSVLRLTGGRTATSLRLPPDRTIAAIALDHDFADSGAVYLAWYETTLRGRTLAVSRFREVAGVLAQEAVVLPPLPVPTSGTARLAVDAEGLVYVALPGEPGASGTGSDPAWGSIVRITASGATPWEKGQTSPVLTSGFAEPLSLGASRSGADMWLSGGSPAQLVSLPAVTPAAAARSVGRTLGNERPVVALTVLADGHVVVFATDDGRLWTAPTDDPGAVVQVPFDDGTPGNLVADPADPECTYALIALPGGGQALYRIRILEPPR